MNYDSKEEVTHQSGSETSNVNLCENKGCGFNENSNCTASGTQCFGYMKLEGEQ